MWKNSDLFGLQETPKEAIENLLAHAKTMKKLLTEGKTSAALAGKTVVLLFYENSTRTRVSFELAGKYLGASTTHIAAGASSVTKGETLTDTGKTLDQMGTDAIVLRHSVSGSPEILARAMRAPVINAGDGMHEHPTQGLLDMFTILEEKGTLKGLKVAITGDVRHSRVARSNIWGLTKMGAEVWLSGPGTLMPPTLAETGVKIAPLSEALRGADVVMALRVQTERQKAGLFPSLSEYAGFYGLNMENIRLADSRAIVLHPGPMNRGVEISGDLADAPQSRIEAQVQNGVAVRMALLDRVING